MGVYAGGGVMGGGGLLEGMLYRLMMNDNDITRKQEMGVYVCMCL